jgi:hypothetical protein
MGYHGTGVNYHGRELDELRNPVVHGQGASGLSQAQQEWQQISSDLRQVGLYVESSMNKNSAAQEGAAADATQAQGLSPLAAYAQAAQIQADFAAEATANQAEYYQFARNGMPEHMDPPRLWPDILTPWEYFRKKREYDRRVDRATDQMYTYQTNSNSNIGSMPVFTQPAATDIGMSIPQGTQVNPGAPTTSSPTMPAGSSTVPAGGGGLPSGSLGQVAGTPGVPGGGIRGPGIPSTSPVGGLPGTPGIPGVPGYPGTGPGGGGIRPGVPGETIPGTSKPGSGTTRPGGGTRPGIRPGIPSEPGTVRPGTGTVRPGTGTGAVRPGVPGTGAVPGEGVARPGGGRTGAGRPGVPGGSRPGEFGRPGGSSRLMPGNLGAGMGEEGLRSTRGFGPGAGEGPFGRGAAGEAFGRGAGGAQVGRGAGGAAGEAFGRGGAAGFGEPGAGGRAGAGAAGARGSAAGNGFGPMGTGADGEDDLEHKTPDYLVGEDIFRDSSLVAPPVIGDDMPDYYNR